jgi:hypothetical protein
MTEWYQHLPSMVATRRQLYKDRREDKLTGAADTTEGLDSLTSSEKISAKSIGTSAFGGLTKPSLICTVPLASVFVRVETRGTSRACKQISILSKPDLEARRTVIILFEPIFQMK